MAETVDQGDQLGVAGVLAKTAAVVETVAATAPVEKAVGRRETAVHVEAALAVAAVTAEAGQTVVAAVAPCQ